jgi:hypothetical protein
MNTNTHQCALFLCTRQHNFAIDNDLLITQLQNINFISKAINNQKNSFYTGSRHLDYIAYMGCSPSIQFEESETSSTFCHIKIHQYDAAKLMVSQIQARSPHCPKCSKPVDNWLNNKTEKTITCDLCNTTTNIGEFNWRKMAGYAHLFIEITDIFPKEAVPQQILLDQLSEVFQTDWCYFYCCS